ncbi:MAG: hypothetical protein [Olavius algarvensis Gamma 1 endosymbiont]|nr:MAG: hypothetical protein [Olavius algarvensis Gamma 1 endosymbiont]
MELEIAGIYVERLCKRFDKVKRFVTLKPQISLKLGRPSQRCRGRRLSSDECDDLSPPVIRIRHHG